MRVAASSEMPRYYFDVRDVEGLSRDDEGIDLPNLDIDVREAQRSLRVLTIAALPEVDLRLQVEVREEPDGAVMQTVTLGSK